ncbi:MAG: GTP cyclohydrolase [Eubacteriales bacterium SKADARSKE-1]|nr:GTP cyclohydrolase [Eubacteriales bacterium SKADARSKE-1]
MPLVKDIYNYLDQLYPFNLAIDFDNVGILVGDGNKKVTRSICCLDVMPDVIDEAKNLGVNLIISHHPVIFDPIKNLKPFDIVYQLVAAKINVICAHTNLDIAPGGVNSCLAEKLELKNLEVLSHLENNSDHNVGLGLVGTLENSLSSFEFAKYIKEKLHCNGLKYTNTLDKKISRVAVGSGACGNLINDVIFKKADAFVAGEIKHHEILLALQNNIVVVDVGHFKSEDVVVLPLVKVLQEKFPSIEFLKSTTCTDKIKYI